MRLTPFEVAQPSIHSQILSIETARPRPSSNREKPSISVKRPGPPWLFHRPGSLSSLCYAPPAQAYHASRLRRFRQTLPVVPSSPLAVWAGCPSLLRSVRLWITGRNVVE
ncbi:hypothetical protein ZIOFF_074340 (mitochondrion) [Zingiber officinale]|uniref:Uncharacterized protein n=1 Tax=Zingiber officinale TaxID=94328 RepID=A0A8J5E9G4_ZINOF|nr:hypothetical protein ZIOFF_074340 [Zingiber officinale]